MRTLVLLLLAATASAAPEARTIDIRGERRDYLLVRPEKKTSSQRPLVIILHGHMGSARQALGLKHGGRSALARWVSLAEQEGFLVAAPDGKRGPDDQQGWNDCRADANDQPKTDDVAFLDAMTQELIATEGANPSQIYVTGMSNGAMMTFRAAAEMKPRPAAIAAVCGLMAAKSACRPLAAPVSAMLVLGTEDPLVPYAGGTVGFSRRKGRGTVLSADETASRLLAAAGIPGEPAVEPVTHRDEKDPTRVTRNTWGPMAGPQVVLVRVDGGGHVEPSPTIAAGRLYKLLVGKQNRDFETADEVWAFFRGKRAR